MVKITNLKVYTKDFLDGIDNKVLYGSKCQKCGDIQVPAKVICTACQNPELELVEVKPEGKIASFTCIGVGTTHFVNKGYTMKKPYCVAIVELEIGAMISAQLMDGDITYDENQDPLIGGKPIKVGAPVVGEYEEYKETIEGKRGGPQEIDRCRLIFKLK
ncbi:MAG: OB-fold domain-containing protein [Candidatus Helarchaeota archaeon]|nr:OB-fold domain-containing protein [Candidatus Helarchaeota archaeon]